MQMKQDQVSRRAALMAGAGLPPMGKVDLEFFANNPGH